MFCTHVRKMDAEVCMVCMSNEGDDHLYVVCRCNTKVHAHCFHKMVTTVEAHNGACPVCKHRYVQSKNFWNTFSVMGIILLPWILIIAYFAIHINILFALLTFSLSVSTLDIMKTLFPSVKVNVAPAPLQYVR